MSNKINQEINLILKDNVSASAKKISESFKSLFDNSSSLSEVIEATSGIFEESVDAIKSSIDILASGMAESSELIDANIATTEERFLQMKESASSTMQAITVGFNDATGGLAGYATVINDTSKMYGDFVKACGVATSVVDLLTTSQGRATIATNINAVATKAQAIALNIGTTAMKAFNLVVQMSPLLKFVAIIAAFAAGLRIAYVHNDKFREIVDKCWNSLKAVGAYISEKLIVFFGGLKKVMSAVGGLLKMIFGVQEDGAESSKKLADETKGLADETIKIGDSTDELGKSLENQIKFLDSNIGKVKELKEELTGLQKAQRDGTVDTKEIEVPKKGFDIKPTLDLEAESTKIKDFSKKAAEDFEKANPKPVDKTKGYQAGLSGINSIMGDLSKVLDNNSAKWVKWGGSVFENISKALPDMSDRSKSFQAGLTIMTESLKGLSGILGETAGAWIEWGVNVISAIGTAIPQIIALTTTQATSAEAQVTSNAAVAGSGALASMASIPFVGPILAIAALASIVAAVASLPKPKKFATGGIVYGNTFAQVGEYPGAANNPEVIAPLSKLRNLIEPSGSMNGQVEFRIAGNTLRGILQKVNKIDSRTR